MNDAKFFKCGLQLSQPVMSFGSLCPGRRYALLQLKWFLLTIFTRFQLRYKQHSQTPPPPPAPVNDAETSRLPQYDVTYHGHEVLPPVADVDVEFRCRDNWTNKRLRLIE